MQAKSHCRTEQGEERIQQEKESPQKGQSQIPQGTSKEARRETRKTKTACQRETVCLVQGGLSKQTARDDICHENPQIKRERSAQLFCQPLNKCSSRISQLKDERLHIRTSGCT